MTETESSTTGEGVKGRFLERLAGLAIKSILKNKAKQNDDGTTSVRFEDSDVPGRFVEFFDLMDNDKRIGVRMVIPEGAVTVDGVVMIEAGDIFGGLD